MAHPYSLDKYFQYIRQDERRTANREFAAMLADEYILSFISLSAHIQPTEFYQLLLLSSSSFFNLPAGRQVSSGSGLDIKKYQHSSKLWSLPVMLKDDTTTKNKNKNSIDEGKN